MFGMGMDGMGMGMLGMEMMEAELIGAEMGMMMGMGMGMGMRGIGYCPPGCMGPCCQRVIVCPPGCMGPCCVNRQMMYPQQYYPNQYPVSQYAIGQNAYVPNQLLPPQQVQIKAPQLPQAPQVRQIPQSPQMIQSPQILQSPQVLQPAKPVRNQQLTDIERIRQQDMAMQVQLLRQAQLNKKMKEQKQLLAFKKMDERLKQIRQENEKMQRQIKQKQLYQQQPRQGTSSPSKEVPANNNSNPYNQIIFKGEIHQKVGNTWQYVKEAVLNYNGFMSLPIEAINKIKIKAESQLQGTRIVKICAGAGEYFYSMPQQDQMKWMIGLIASKLQSLGFRPNSDMQYGGPLQGLILKKGFFGGWDRKYGNLTSHSLIISDNFGGALDKTITAVPQIWTRFEIINGSFLVLKMHHSGFKLQLGVPIDDVLLWLRGLYGLIRF